MRNRQVGPDEATAVLAALVPRVAYKPGWTFDLKEIERGQGCEGLTLLIGASVPDSCVEGATTNVLHLFPVLPAAYIEDAWQEWILECILMVERHESTEWFKVDGTAPFFPDHGPGRNPYSLARIKPPEQPAEPATPWRGGPVTDPHFTP